MHKKTLFAAPIVASVIVYEQLVGRPEEHCHPDELTPRPRDVFSVNMCAVTTPSTGAPVVIGHW